MADTQTTIAEKIADIKTDRAKIRNHMKDNWGVATDTDKLKELATKITAIEKKTVAKELPEGTGKYYIPKGYHDGTGWVEAVNNEDLDAQEYKLEEGRSVTPTTEDQVISKSEGFYGLGAVTVNKIPTQYKDTTDVTATQEDVLATKLFVDNQGLKPGTMTNNGKVTKTLDTETTRYTIAKGYHDGTGSVSITTEKRTAMPTKTEQTIEPASGNVLSKVTVKAIPDEYADITGVTAGAVQVLEGWKFVDETGVLVTGTMENHESVTKCLTVNDASYTIPKGYHEGLGKVYINRETKTVTPTKSEQTVTPGTSNVLISVKVNPIPDNYADTTDATAEAADILTGKIAYAYEEDDAGNKIAKQITGAMENQGAKNIKLDVDTTSYTIPEGYHNGNGKVSISVTHEMGTAQKNEFTTVFPPEGFLLGSVTINPIPSNYIITTDATATAAQILSGKTAYVRGSKVTGSMTNNGAVTASINGLTTTSYTIPAGYHDGSGTVSLTADIENALAEI